MFAFRLPKWYDLLFSQNCERSPAHLGLAGTPTTWKSAMTDLRGFDPRRLLKTGKAARRLNVTPETVRAWVAAGVLTAVRPGGRNMFVQLDSIERLERGEIAQPHDAPLPDAQSSSGAVSA
jgi:excisionase family DNA binding protein